MIEEWWNLPQTQFFLHWWWLYWLPLVVLAVVFNAWGRRVQRRARGERGRLARIWQSDRW